MDGVEEASTGSGHDALPDQQREALHRAIRIEWISLGVLAVSVVLIGLVAGQSQAMQAAFFENLLSFLPPIAFLVATRVIRIGPNRRHPYGHHRSIGTAHLVAATALLAMGLFLVYSSGSALLMGERPPIGLTVLFGQEIWAGWLMIAVMAVTAVPPVFLGRRKMKLAKQLHDKVLHADADMDKADWQTSLATIIGVLGIGIGLWWTDSVAALIVAGSILLDGGRNLRAAVEDLTDMRAMTFDERDHPLIDDIETRAAAVEWVAEAVARVRDQGHVFHVEMFVVPVGDHNPTVDELHDLRELLQETDWKIHDVVVVPMRSLPIYLTQDDPS